MEPVRHQPWNKVGASAVFAAREHAPTGMVGTDSSTVVWRPRYSIDVVGDARSMDGLADEQFDCVFDKGRGA